MTFAAPDWAGWELDLMRLFIVWLVFRRCMYTGLPRYPDQPHPIGLARVIDLSFIHRGHNFRTARWLIVPFGTLYVLSPWEWLTLVGLGYLTALLLVEITFSSSQGAVNHGRHLLLVALVAEWVGRATFAGLGRADMVGIDGLLLHDAASTGIWWALQAMMAVYFISGVSKCLRSGFGWLHDSPGFATDMVARAEMSYQDRRGDDATRARSLNGARYLSEHRLLAMVIFGGGLALELFAPVALYNRWTLAIGGLLMMSLHYSIGVFLHLGFKLYRFTLLVYLVNVPYWIVEAADALGAPDSWLPGR